jgi:hypothetical protein
LRHGIAGGDLVDRFAGSIKRGGACVPSAGICRRSGYVMACRRKLNPFREVHHGDKSRSHQEAAD